MALVASAASMHVPGATARISLSFLYQVIAVRVCLAYMPRVNILVLITSSKAPGVRIHTWVGFTLPVINISPAFCHSLSLEKMFQCHARHNAEQGAVCSFQAR